MFQIVFMFMFVMIVFTAVKGIAQWNSNNNSPRLTVSAFVVAKRANVTHTQNFNGGDVTGAKGIHMTSTTVYYVTFEVESKDRMEFCVSGSEYGHLTEGDHGNLTFQGSRYLGFDRIC